MTKKFKNKLKMAKTIKIQTGIGQKVMICSSKKIMQN